MGHIQYYMHANKQQPPLFQDATNSAFNEAIGDAIFLAMMTPQHLNRLGLLTDEFLFPDHKITLKKLLTFYNHMRVIHEIKPNFKFLEFYKNLENSNNISTKNFQRNFYRNSIKNMDFNNNEKNVNFLLNSFDNSNKNDDNNTNSILIINNFDISLLLRIALMKLPQIPFEYILDIFRWDLFNGKISYAQSNSYFWKLCQNEQGIHPSELRNQEYLFDAASKFHVADNTPYVR